MFGVLLTACLASVVPHLAEFMSLIGAISGFPLAVIIPCIVDLLVRWGDESMKEGKEGRKEGRKKVKKKERKKERKRE